MTTTARRERTVDASSERTLESLALAVGATAFVVGALVALIVLQLESTPISGPGSIGQFCAIGAAAAAILAFVAGRYIARVPGRRVGVLDVVDIAALAFAHAVIALLTWTLLAVILERSFIDAEVFGPAGLVIAGAVIAVTAYVAFFSATHLNLQLLALVLAVFLVEGVIASMLTASDPHWWKDNLSALGMTDDLSALTFNLTLIVAGVIVVTLARSVTQGVPTPVAHGAMRVRACLIVVGVFLACVGIFPVDRFFWIHTGFASGMAVAFGILVILLPRWIPGLPRGFFAVGWLFIAVIVVLGVFFAIGYYTLTAVELVAGILVFAWIILFIRNAAALQQDTEADGAISADAVAPLR
ncbi:MAG: hypothetical protein M3Y31_06305 [Gemmatimonadota bacterium]|nr:hypothetical protein [Gemmatimonadota bacterium]